LGLAQQRPADTIPSIVLRFHAWPSPPYPGTNIDQFLPHSDMSCQCYVEQSGRPVTVLHRMVFGLCPVSFRLRLCRVPTLRGSVGMAWGYSPHLGTGDLYGDTNLCGRNVWAGMLEVRRYLGLLRHEVARDSLDSDFGIDALRATFLTFENPFLGAHGFRKIAPVRKTRNTEST
jgi:hypothetical protein